jgi:ABC-type polysaccharide/polyol phosphate transport system ATPase subunit
MRPIALEFDGVWKKFRKGERYDCLRDLIPETVKSIFSGNNRDELKDQEFWALRDVSFQIKPGEAVGVIGPNGSGKSTTLKLLSGILKPTKGNVKVNGRLSALIEVAAGFHPDLTGRENIFLNGAILGMRKAEIDRKFDEIVNFSGLEEFIDTPVKRYSSGMYARLGFSVAAHVDPEILLVDEVLSVGDMSFQQRCMEKMQEKINADVAVIFVSHNLAAVATLCNRVLFLDKGNVLVDGSPGEALEAYASAARAGNLKANEVPERIRIVDVELKTPANQGTGMIGPHTSCELVVIIECLAPLPPCNVGFVIRRVQDMLLCYRATTQELGYPLFELAPGDRLAVRFKFDAHLTRGHYWVDLHVRDPYRAKFLAQLDGAASFTIDEQISSWGVANVGLRASVQKFERSGNRLDLPLGATGKTIYFR